MASPTARDLTDLRNIARYLAGKPQMKLMCKWQSPARHVQVHTDSDWAGCLESAKSTGGGAARIGCHCIRTWADAQRVIVLSSAEAELYALVRGATAAVGLQSLAEDMGVNWVCA